MKKQAISACLAGAMLASTIAGPALAVSVDEFTDVKSTDWFYPYVQKVAEKDYMIGVGGNLFAPATQMSRAMFVTVLARLEGVDEESAKSNFDDVPDDTWYTSAVNWAAANGIVEGNGAGQFMPEDEITRQDMCTMMARYVAYHQKKHNVTHVKPGTKKDFTDEDQIADYAAKFVDQCVAWGLIEGNDLGQFMPKSFTTRAEAAAVISRLSWKSNGGGGGGGVVPDDDEDDDAETYTYSVKATLTVPTTVNATNTLDLFATYSGIDSIAIAPNMSTLANDLFAGENVTLLQNAFDAALQRVKYDDNDELREITRTVKGQQITIKIDDNGVISATVAMKVTDLIKDTTRAASEEQMVELITKLQNGEAVQKSDYETLESLIDKANTLAAKSEEEIKKLMDDFVADSPALQKALEGIDSGNVQTMAQSYKEQLTNIKKQFDNNPQLEQVEIPEPVVMDVTLNLATYLKDISSTYFPAANDTDQDSTANKKMAAAIDRLEANLYPANQDGTSTGELSADAKDKAEALYRLNNPSNYVKSDEGNGTLTLLTPAEYVDLIQQNVTASMEFYASLGEDQTFYSGLLNRLQAKYDDDNYGVTYTNMDHLAALLGDKEGSIFTYSAEDGTTKFRETNDMDFSITATMQDGDADIFENWVDIITGEFEQLDDFEITLGSIPASILGSYTLDVSFERQ